MKKILVSLVSEQTVPNVIVTEHFKPDIYWFISTKRMENEGKTGCIENTLRLMKHELTEKNVRTLIVNQDSLVDCIEKMEDMTNSVDEEAGYVVNLTGGNKIMAIAALEVFRDIGQKVIIGYMPLGKNEFIQIYPKKRPLKTYEIPERLALEEYLSCYGFEIKNKKKLSSVVSASLSRETLTEWIMNNFKELKGLLGFLYKNTGNKRKEAQVEMSDKFNREPSRVEKEFLEKFDFKLKNRVVEKKLKKDEIIYLTGGWFEEYVFNEVYKMTQEKFVNDVKMGIQISSASGADNELDIAFMKDNTFYHIECKTLGEEEEQSIIGDEVYKKGAILPLLGKGGKAFICTTHTSIKPSLSNRARDYNIEIFNLAQIRNLPKELSERIR
ncbi:MAG: DUF1887 family protein [Nitrospirae bacterium]|nr:DUF1887 family protein [Nitrospirota bacterium]